MKTIFTTIFVSFGLVLMAQKPKLTISIKGLKSSKGQMLIQIVDEDNKDVTGKIEKLSSKTYSTTIELPAKGKYAVNVIHDKNNNKKLDTNIIGIPTEGWGCSNDARGKLGPPKHKDKIIDVNTDKSITINLVHY